jgi:hypothetical protein
MGKIEGFEREHRRRTGLQEVLRSIATLFVVNASICFTWARLGGQGRAQLRLAKSRELKSPEGRWTK